MNTRPVVVPINRPPFGYVLREAAAEVVAPPPNEAAAARRRLLRDVAVGVSSSLVATFLATWLMRRR